MYLYHFGLKELPFGLTPDTGFFCDLPGHIEAMNVLKVALASGEGFVKITGEVGTGKTLLCRQLLNYFEKTHACAYLPNPYLSPEELRFALASELGLRVSQTLDQSRLTERISRRLIKIHKTGKPVVLMVDEAQALPDKSLEALRLITNLETEKKKLLQVVLFGQPELDQRLAQTHLRQLRQRISFSYRLPMLDRQQTEKYINHRIQAAAINGSALKITFNNQAISKLHRFSRGVPRLINIIAHKALMLSYGEGVYQVKARQIKLAAKDTDDVNYQNWWLKIFSILIGLDVFMSEFVIAIKGLAQ